MKKRLFRNLLMLGLLLITLTAAVQYTTEETEKKVSTNVSILYKCDVCKGYRHIDDADMTVQSIQPRTTDGKNKPLAEWKPGDALVMSASIEGTFCPQCKANGVQTLIRARTFSSVISDMTAQQKRVKFFPPLNSSLPMGAKFVSQRTATASRRNTPLRTVFRTTISSLR